MCFFYSPVFHHHTAPHKAQGADPYNRIFPYGFPMRSIFHIACFTHQHKIQRKSGSLLNLVTSKSRLSEFVINFVFDSVFAKTSTTLHRN